jgi:hypothetical protein
LPTQEVRMPILNAEHMVQAQAVFAQPAPPGPAGPAARPEAMPRAVRTSRPSCNWPSNA